MLVKKQLSFSRKILYGIMLVGIFISVFDMGGLTYVNAQTATNSTSIQIGGQILSDGQFVYGSNIGDFNVKTYLESNAPYLSKYADGLYGRSEYFSMNPKIYLTLLEIHSHLISDPNIAVAENPFGFSNSDFMSQVEYLSSRMTEAYYLHIYSYSALPAARRSLKPYVSPSGNTINVTSDTNAGTYAIIAGLAAMDEQNIPLILDNSQKNGFYQTYRRLFGNNDPLDETNHIYIPGKSDTLTFPNNLLPIPGSDQVTGASPAPSNLLQLPYLQGLSWKFGGVHNTDGTTTFTDASSMDFYPSGAVWGIDTSNMWVVAAAAGIPTRYSDCGYKISHSGALNQGWETTYYHLEGAKYLSGSVNQNDKIGVIANTEAEATCTGGSASGPHVHFSLKYNGAYVAINGTALSGWYVHSGRYSYDVDKNYMWLERDGVKKYAYIDFLLSEAPPTAISGNAGAAGAILSYNDGTPKTVVADGSGNYTLIVSYDWSGTVTPASVCYSFSPLNMSYSNVTANQTAPNYTAVYIPSSYTLTGTTSVGGVTLSYTDGTAKTTTSDNSGNYSITVPCNWSGTITPSKTGFIFSPTKRAYTNVITNLTAQNYALHWADTAGVFRPSDGALYLKNSNTTGYADVAINYGVGGDYPVTGDWDGNGTATIGIYRNGVFYLRNSNTIGYADIVFAFGVPGDQPIAGDWNGDGIDTIGVFRPSTGQFLMRDSNSAGAADYSFFLGNVDDVGIAGDWINQGFDTVGVFRPSNGIIFLKNTNATGFADIALNYGLAGDQPVTGDWDGNGTDTIGVYRNAQFLLRNSNTVGFADLVFGLGNPGDMPIAGDWDGLP